MWLFPRPKSRIRQGPRVNTNEDTKLNQFQDGWFKSGDLGSFDKDNFLWISGRSKELIITAGGENIAPILIENSIRSELSEIVSNIMVVGDQKKYLTCLITLKCKVDQNGMPTNLLDETALNWSKSICSEPISTIEEVQQNNQLKAQYIY
jgi:long-chain-fatty-acid--CoA ligase ACSBG